MIAVGMTDLVPVDVTGKVNEVVLVEETVKLTDVAAVVVAELEWEGGPVQESVDNAAELVDVAVVVITECQSNSTSCDSERSCKAYRRSWSRGC